MDGQVAVAPVVRRAGEGDKRWFFGGGVWTWKASGADSAGGLVVVEVEMDAGKATPLHTHPIAESLWVLEGRLRYHIDGDDFELGVGDFVMVPGGIAARFPRAGRSGARADDPALGRLRGVLPRGERTPRGFGP